MKKKNVYGCACCSPGFGTLFRSNRQIVELAAHAPPLVATQAIDTDDVERRAFIKVAE